jgi:nitroimidazol reductase NimA-like FMN-containing flavoprotein (pyridoxamine 5'-phosphate oxidase superfamily)
MQQRMKEFSMENADVLSLLSRAQVGHFSTINGDGFPYTLAVHFVYEGGEIYFHCLPKGEKLDNIARCPKVCFEVDEMTGLLTEKMDNPCGVDTAYRSVVAFGTADILSDDIEKRKILGCIVQKYTPKFKDVEIPDSRIQSTSVVKITIIRITGKYHR